MATEAKSQVAATDFDRPAESVELSIVAPAYNEARNLTPLVKEITVALSGTEYQRYEIVIVDDGSNDDTADVIYHLAALFDTVRGLHLTRNFGQSLALRAGIDAAEGDIIVTMDADGQNDPADIPDLLAELSNGYDCVSGWRADRDDSWQKTIPSNIQTHLAKRLGPDINDFGCTLKAYRAEALDDIDLWGEGHRYIPAKLYKRGYQLGELTVNHRPRNHGNSRYGAGRLIRGFVDLLYHYFDVHFSMRPMHLLGGSGLVFMATGGAIGLFSVLQKYAFGVELAPRLPRLVLVSLLVIFGLQLFVFGVLAEMLSRLEYRDEPPYRIEQVVG